MTKRVPGNLALGSEIESLYLSDIYWRQEQLHAMFFISWDLNAMGWYSPVVYFKTTLPPPSRFQRYQRIKHHSIRAQRLFVQVHLAPWSDSCNGLTCSFSVLVTEVRMKLWGTESVCMLDVLDLDGGPSGFKTSQILLSRTPCLLMLSVLKFYRETA